MLEANCVVRSNVHLAVTDQVYRRFLLLPARRPLDGALAENAAWARNWFALHARPWLCAARREEESAAWVVAASAGPEVVAEAAARWQAEEPDRYFFLDRLGAAHVEAMLHEFRRRLGTVSHASPGHRGTDPSRNVEWVDWLRSKVSLPGPLDVLSSGALSPRLSQVEICRVEPAPAGLPVRLESR